MTTELVQSEAKRLVNRFYLPDNEDLVVGGYGVVPKSYYETAKLCAIVTVEEIIKIAPYVEIKPHLYPTECVEFWERVKEYVKTMKL